MPKKKLGSQTPTASFIIPYKKSFGNKAIETYEKTERKAQRWQKLLIKDIMATMADGLWIHTKFGYSVPRRNGKNEIVAIREMYGLVNGERILHTAHRLSTARTAWERLDYLLTSANIDHTVTRSDGRQSISTASGRIDFRTRSPKGGLGEGFDLLVIDEAQEYTDDQETALKYVVSDSKNPQTIFCGTPPTPISSGTVFMKFRKNTLQGIGSNAGWAEWSVDSMTDVNDVSSWYLTNPSLGTILTERKIKDEITDDNVDFNIQRLGLWIRYNQKSAISEADWDALEIKRPPKIIGGLFVGIKYSIDGLNVALAIAAKTSTDITFVEVFDRKPTRLGNDWIIAYLKQIPVQEIVIDGASGSTLLAKDIKDAKVRVKTIIPKVKEVIEIYSTFERGVFAKTLCHSGQQGLKDVATNCEKRAIGSNGGFGYRSLVVENGIEILESVALAYWACESHKPKKAQKVGY